MDVTKVIADETAIVLSVLYFVLSIFATAGWVVYQVEKEKEVIESEIENLKH